jgi:hypothetical protein
MSPTLVATESLLHGEPGSCFTTIWDYRDDTTDTLSMFGGSLCYIFPYLCVDDLVDHSRLAGHEQYRSKSDPARATPSRRDMSSFTTYPLDTSGGQRLLFTSLEDISRLFIEHLEVHRFLQLSPSKQPSTWKERRKTCAFFRSGPTVWDLDALYLRHTDERAY